MRCRIIKLGGSALRSIDHLEEAAARVAAAVEAQLQPVVVVSAMEGSTNRLLATARRLHPDPPGEELDRLLATGELQAAHLVAMALDRRGVRARSLSGGEAGILTDDRFGRARILDVDPAPLTAALAAGETPVVAGFQGATAEGQVTTLGRGGSDISAVALGVALAADRVVFVRDVEGIHSADPKLLAVSWCHPRLDYDSLLDLAEAGAPILHPQALEVARAHHLPLEVRGLVTNSASTTVNDHGSPGNMPVWSISLSHPISMLTVEGLSADTDTLSRLVALLDRTELKIDVDLRPAGGDDRMVLALCTTDIDGPSLQEQVRDFLREETGLRFTLERQRRRITLVGRGVGSRRVGKAIEQVVEQQGPPLATWWGEHFRAFVVPEREGRAWLASLHQELIAPQA